MFTVTEFTLLHQRIQSRAKPCFPTLCPKSASINPIRSSVVVCAFSCSVISDSVTPWIVACRGPLTIRFYRQEYLSGLPFPPPRDPDPPSWSRDWTHVSCVSCIGRWILDHSAPWEVTISSNTLYSCFALLCQFLSYSEVNQPYVYIYPLLFWMSFLFRSPESTEWSSLCSTVGCH